MNKSLVGVIVTREFLNYLDRTHNLFTYPLNALPSNVLVIVNEDPQECDDSYELFYDKESLSNRRAELLRRNTSPMKFYWRQMYNMGNFADKSKFRETSV